MSVSNSFISICHEKALSSATHEFLNFSSSLVGRRYHHGSMTAGGTYEEVTLENQTFNARNHDVHAGFTRSRTVQQ
jgi:hypothetical protein